MRRPSISPSPPSRAPNNSLMMNGTSGGLTASQQDAVVVSRRVVPHSSRRPSGPIGDFFLNCFPASERVRNKNDTRPVTARQRHSKGDPAEFQKRIVVRLGPGLGELKNGWPILPFQRTAFARRCYYYWRHPDLTFHVLRQPVRHSQEALSSPGPGGRGCCNWRQCSCDARHGTRPPQQLTFSEGA